VSNYNIPGKPDTIWLLCTCSSKSPCWWYYR